LNAIADVRIKIKPGSVRLITGFWSGWYFHLWNGYLKIFQDGTRLYKMLYWRN